MRILAVTYYFLPDSNTGGTWTLFNVLKFLKQKGHEVRVLHLGAHCNYEVDGIEVVRPPLHQNYVYQWSDIVLTQLDASKVAPIYAAKAHKTVVHFLHNTNNTYNVERFPQNSVVYNSKWMKECMKLDMRWLILNPYSDPDYYDLHIDPINNEYITLINMNENKGGRLFTMLAKEMPEKKFLGVLGYEEQITADLPNLTILPNTSDIREVYRMTKILLMPSKYESWGRTATESMCNGIPIICNYTDGLYENCYEAAVYMNRPDMWVGNKWEWAKHTSGVSDWVDEINNLEHEAIYKLRSEMGKMMYESQNHKQQMEAFNEWLIAIR